MAAYGIFAKDIDGSSFIPATQRPDGTWRKSRRVKEGYVPQDEVPLYESKGRQIVKNKPQYPVGMSPPVVDSTTKECSVHKRCPIPGLVIEEDYLKKAKNKKKCKNKTPSIDKLSEKISNTLIKDDSNSTVQDPNKRLKNLKKKLRNIENLEQKLKTGELKNIEKEQLEKVKRKDEVLDEIQKIESLLSK